MIYLLPINSNFSFSLSNVCECLLFFLFQIGTTTKSVLEGIGITLPSRCQSATTQPTVAPAETDSVTDGKSTPLKMLCGGSMASCSTRSVSDSVFHHHICPVVRMRERDREKRERACENEKCALIVANYICFCLFCIIYVHLHIHSILYSLLQY